MVKSTHLFAENSNAETIFFFSKTVMLFFSSGRYLIEQRCLKEILIVCVLYQKIINGILPLSQSIPSMNGPDIISGLSPFQIVFTCICNYSSNLC